MRTSLVVLAVALSGCATTAVVVPTGGDAETQAALQARGTTRSTSGSSTQTVGLPLSRAGKIGLWAGVAVFRAYLMASDGEEESADAVDP
jgi:uncharacterized protein YceK